MDLLLLFLPLFNLAESPLKRMETNQFDRVTWKRGERVLSKKKQSPHLYAHNEEADLKNDKLSPSAPHFLKAEKSIIFNKTVAAFICLS